MVSVMPGRTEKASAARIIGAGGLRVRFLESTLHFLTGKLQKCILETASQSIFMPLDITVKSLQWSALTQTFWKCLKQTHCAQAVP